jgi:hypothetical protein
MRQEKQEENKEAVSKRQVTRSVLSFGFFVLVAGKDSDSRSIAISKQVSGSSLAVPGHSTCVAGEKVVHVLLPCDFFLFLQVSKQAKASALNR